jgi:uridine kinase
MNIMNEIKNYYPGDLADKIIQYLHSTGKKFLFLSGNGGSGKTELSKLISILAAGYGHVNVLDMDDFVVDTKLRNSAKITWLDNEKGEQTGRYTTSFAASYFLQNIKAILYNIENGNNYYHWPKKALEAKECRLLYGNAILTIIDGSGTVFLDKKEDNSASIFMQCSKEIEIARRIKRGRFSNEQNAEEVYRQYAERNSQYKANIESHINEYGIVLDSLEDYSLNVIRDDYKILL